MISMAISTGKFHGLVICSPVSGGFEVFGLWAQKLTVCDQKWLCSPGISKPTTGQFLFLLGGWSLKPPSGEFRSFKWAILAGVVTFLIFCSTLFGYILLTSLVPAGSKTSEPPSSHQNKTRSAAWEGRRSRKMTPAKFLVGGLPNPPLQTPLWATDGLIRRKNILAISPVQPLSLLNHWRQLVNADYKLNLRQREMSRLSANSHD